MREWQNFFHAAAQATTPLALATIVRTTGSSYRQPGARLLILPDGRTIGTLSGGCLEEEVAQRAQSTVDTGVPQLFSLETRQRFGCHGTLDIFVERIEPENAFFSYVAQCLTARQDARVRVIFENAPQLGSFVQAGGDARGFTQIIAPPIRLIMIGDGPETEALLGFGEILGWEMLLREHPDLTVTPDARTALLVKNHHFGRDYAALQSVLAQPFGYLGLLGSRKRKQQLLQALTSEDERLAENGLPHFYAPAGLDLGAETPEEIALSIVAEIQTVMAGHSAGFLRERRTPIHAANGLL